MRFAEKARGHSAMVVLPVIAVEMVRCPLYPAKSYRKGGASRTFSCRDHAAIRPAAKLRGACRKRLLVLGPLMRVPIVAL